MPRPIKFLLVTLVLAGSLRAAEPAPAPASGVPAVKSAVPSSLAPRFKQVQERIADLYQNRNAKPAPPDPKFNPFRPPGAKVSVVEKSVDNEEPVIPPAATNLMVLQQGAATLKISGLFEMGGHSQVVINKRPYKVGDVVQTQVQGEPVYLRVREIKGRTVTLTLHDAELTLKF